MDLVLTPLLSLTISYYCIPYSFFSSPVGLHAVSETQWASSSLMAFPFAGPLPPGWSPHSPQPTKNRTKPMMLFPHLLHVFIEVSFSLSHLCLSFLPFLATILTYCIILAVRFIYCLSSSTIMYAAEVNGFCSFCSLLFPKTQCKWMNTYGITLCVWDCYL